MSDPAGYNGPELARDVVSGNGASTPGGAAGGFRGSSPRDSTEGSGGGLPPGQHCAAAADRGPDQALQDRRRDVASTPCMPSTTSA